MSDDADWRAGIHRTRPPQIPPASSPVPPYPWDAAAPPAEQWPIVDGTPAPGRTGSGGEHWNVGWPTGNGGAHARGRSTGTGRRRRGLLVASVVALMLVAAAGGAVIGHAVWPTTSATGPVSAGGTGSPGSSGPKGTAAPGAPADAAAIAAATASTLVDVNIKNSYQAIQGAGTGMVLTSNGEILTNNHVIEGATSIRVTVVASGKTYGATVVGYDWGNDVAVLRLVGASGLRTVTIGDSSTVARGDGVVAVGNANGARGMPRYAAGSVTAVNQSISAQDEATGNVEQLSGLIETNAHIVAGDSGGALVNTDRNVIGMVTAGTDDYQLPSSATQGYAIPINQARSIATQIETGTSSGTVHVGPTAFLGVELQSPFAGASGAQVVHVVPGSPAEQAGMSSGDTITTFDGQAVDSPDMLSSLILGQTPGARVQAEYVDLSGASHTVTVELASGPPQ